MKYNNKQLNRIKEKEMVLSGEFQKAVWSIIRRKNMIKSRDIAVRIGRGSDQVHNIIKKLISYNMVKKVDGARGAYQVSDYILTGDK
jgi:predicted transcriptional regulator